MEIHGMLNLVNSDVTSTAFASTTRFNTLKVNTISEVSLGTLDADVIVFDRESDEYYTYCYNSWLRSDYHNVILYNGLDTRSLVTYSALNTFTAMVFPGNVNNYLYIDKELFNFGDIGAPQNFVIDFFVDSVKGNGTILYNGLNTGPVDIELNKNLLITTSGSVLVRDPNWALNETQTVTHSADDGYLNVYNPRLKSITKIYDKYLTHVAIIRSGETTYLAIDGVIEASAPSVEYNHFDPVKIGAGYVGAFNGAIINLRVSKGTDLGWTNGFFNNIPYLNPSIVTSTKFLLTDGSSDRSANFTIDKMGNNLEVYNDKFPVNLSNYNANSKNAVLNASNNSAYRFPDICYEGMSYEFKTSRFVIYSGKYPINMNSGIVSNKASCHALNKYHRFVFSKDAWHEVTPNFKNLTFPTPSARLLNSRYGKTHAVMPNGNFYDFTAKTNLINWGSSYLSSDTKGFKNFNIPFLRCVQFGSVYALNSYSPDSVYGNSGYTYEFVFKLEWDIIALTKLFIGSDASRYVGFENNRFCMGFGNGYQQCPFDLTAQRWYHMRVSAAPANSTVINVNYYLREIESSNAWSATYGYSGSGYVMSGLRSFSPFCPVNLIFFTSTDMSGQGSVSLASYLQFFTGV